MADSGRTVFGGTGGGGDLFSMGARAWASHPFGGNPEAVDGKVDVGPSFAWTLTAVDPGYNSEFQQRQILGFTDAGIYSVSLAAQVAAPTEAPAADQMTVVDISIDTTSGNYAQAGGAAMPTVANGTYPVSTELTFAAYAGDLFLLRVSSTAGGLVSGAYTYLTVVKLAPYA
jgi:hypothetical protein